MDVQRDISPCQQATWSGCPWLLDPDSTGGVIRGYRLESLNGAS